MNRKAAPAVLRKLWDDVRHGWQSDLDLDLRAWRMVALEILFQASPRSFKLMPLQNDSRLVSCSCKASATLELVRIGIARHMSHNAGLHGPTTFGSRDIALPLQKSEKTMFHQKENNKDEEIKVLFRFG